MSRICGGQALLGDSQRGFAHELDRPDVALDELEQRVKARLLDRIARGEPVARRAVEHRADVRRGIEHPTRRGSRRMRRSLRQAPGQAEDADPASRDGSAWARIRRSHRRRAVARAAQIARRAPLRLKLGRPGSAKWYSIASIWAPISDLDRGQALAEGEAVRHGAVALAHEDGHAQAIQMRDVADRADTRSLCPGLGERERMLGRRRADAGMQPVHAPLKTGRKAPAMAPALPTRRRNAIDLGRPADRAAFPITDPVRRPRAAACSAEACCNELPPHWRAPPEGLPNASLP